MRGMTGDEDPARAPARRDKGVEAIARVAPEGAVVGVIRRASARQAPASVAICAGSSPALSEISQRRWFFGPMM